ncbi:MAG: SGNH/GDSL hydrolase family protein [Lentisphaeria bacterium]|nr:SGNH/GDSL hydrolase family protein [Lentisphaeria bacterium]
MAKILSDAEKNNSSQMNARKVESSICNAGGVRVVFIGNSITLHAPAPNIGWHHNWGMAASAEENDYVHIVIREIEKRTGRKADVRVRNLSAFERNFQGYDHSQNQDLFDFKPEYLIVALGENVAELETMEEKFAYRDAFHKLLNGFMSNDPAPTALVRGVFWKNEWKDQMMKETADAYGIPFVKGDFADDDSMKALGLFEYEGVQAHPGDKGMAVIAQVVVDTLFK